MTITRELFGTTHAGVPVDLFTLTNTHGMTATITNYGGKVVTLFAPDRVGAFADVVLGFDDLAPYLAPNPFFGTLVGRCANRTANAQFTLNGTVYHLTPNEGRNHLHGGAVGFDKVVWDAHASEGANGPQLALTYRSPDGEQGYPGTLDVTVTYTLTHDDALDIRYDAVADKDTVVNLTNHSYFNLAGAGAGSILDHVLRIAAAAFTPTDAEQIPTGEIRPVDGTPMDFRAPTRIGARIGTDDEQLHRGEGYDHNWVLNNDAGRVMPVIELHEPGSGRVLTVTTTAPGVQFYAGNKLGRNVVTGKGGAVYAKNAGLCLETQHFPDATNHPNFPSPVLRAGEHYHQHTVYRFSTR